MDKEQIIEMLKSHMYQFREDGCTLSEFRGIRQFINYLDDMGFADEILALHRDSDPMYAYSKESHRPNCIASVYGRTEDPAKCICHSWQRTGDEPI